MARWLVRRHEETPSAGRGVALLAIGLVSGLAAGAYLAQHLGGLEGITSRLRRQMQGRRRQTGVGPSASTSDTGPPPAVDDGYGEYEEYETLDDLSRDDLADDEPSAGHGAAAVSDEETTMADDESEAFASADPGLEDRVLTAFTNDPVLAERAIDIGAVSAGTIELTGSVNTDDEYEHATVVTRGVPGVSTVVNRLSIRADERVEDRTAQRYADGDPHLAAGQWEHERVGTGRPRQGTSQDVSRHDDPKVPLETRAQDTSEALRNAADEVTP